MSDIAPDSRSYGHFCLLAKALEHVGDRWALLVIRDLLTGPKRFTDLMDRMVGITPKTLTRRLRDLEHDGLVVADREPGRREVWYRLTPAGQSLQPAVEALLLWGLQHLAAPPAPDEPVHPDHLLYALQIHLQHERIDAGTVRWTFHVAGAGDYTLSSEHGDWQLAFHADTASPSDVTVSTSRSALARFLATTGPRDQRSEGLDISGKPAAIRTFTKTLEVFPGKQHTSGAHNR